MNKIQAKHLIVRHVRSNPPAINGTPALFPSSAPYDNITTNYTKEEFAKHYTRKAVKNEQTGKMHRLYFCNHCPKSMPQLCNMVNHLRVHFKLKPYACDYCGKAWATRSNCKNHMKKRSCMRPGYRHYKNTELAIKKF